MEKLISRLKNYETDTSLEVNLDTHKLEQKTRNRLKQELTEALMSDLSAAFANADLNVTVVKIAKGIGLSFKTPLCDFPATIEITMKNTDVDLELEAAEYAEVSAVKAAKKQESMKAKQAKMEADAEKRERKRAERAAKEAKKLESNI